MHRYLLHQHEGHCHGHDHDHEHGQGHSHEHSHTHTHEHSHDGEHSHSHGEADAGMEQTLAIMSYMLDHNRQHADELSGVADKLAAAGKRDAAELIRAGVKSFSLGNDKLAQALNKVQEG